MVHGELKNRGKIVNPIINFLLMGIDFDIVIIGGGGAGMISALAASQSGASVLLLEKTKEIGGHTLNTQGMFPPPIPDSRKHWG